MKVIPAEPASAPQKSARIASIDILRGLAILGMALSGMLPWGTLPAWMYHAQMPPPEMAFKPNVPGITWVDWVFPFFLFALGAAIPLSLTKKLDRGEPWSKTASDLLRRYASLLAFAYLSQHLRPLSINSSPTTDTWLLALLFFGVTVLAFVRIPTNWPRSLQLGVPLTGWLIILAAMVSLPPASEDQVIYFLNTRVDIILFVLANVALSGSILWILTRKIPQFRIGIIAILAAIFLAKASKGPINFFWQTSPLPWFWQTDFHKYLLIILPATFCGEYLLNHAQFKEPIEHSAGAEAAISITAFVLLIGITSTLFFREIEFALFLALVGAAIGITIANRACHFSPGLKSILNWGSFLLVIGVILDPTDGGIKKDSANLSYFFTTGGLAFWLIAAFTSMQKNERLSQLLSPLTLTGQNPILGYVAITNLVPAFIRLLPVNILGPDWISLHGWVGSQGWSPWGMFGYALFQTALVALVCTLASRAKIYLRA